MKTGKTLLILGISLLIGVFMMSQVSYATRIMDELREKRGPESDSRQYAEGFLSETGKVFAHDKFFKLKADKAFQEGRAINIFGHLEEDIDAAAERYVMLNPQIGITKEKVAQQLKFVQGFINTALSDIDFITSTVEKILASRATEEGEALQDAVRGAWLQSENKTIAASRVKQVLLDNTRFVSLLFGDQGLDPYLFSIGNIASEEHRTMVSHAGRYAYDGSARVKGGPRSIYLTLARLNGYKNLKGANGKKAFQELMAHELTDLVRGHVDEYLPTLEIVNAEIDNFYKTEVVKVTQGDRRGAITLNTDKVAIEKYTYTSDLGMKEVFAIKGSSKVHPDVPKGSTPITLSVVKADVGSIGGHGSSPGIMLEAVADVWAEAAAKGEIIDYFITRVGDDISVTVTHLKGKDNETIHQYAWNGFLNASLVATDNSFYGAGQDLLTDSFSGNLKGAGPSFAEMEFVERASEPVIIGQADKTAPGAFNKGLYGIFLDPNTPYVHLSGDEAKLLRFGLIDFDYNDSVGREGEFGVADYQDIAYYIGYPDRVSFTKIVDRNGEDVAAVTAQRLGKIAGKYVGKDDPMFVCRSQKNYPAVGEITAPFLKGDYVVPGWMRGSNKGPFLPVALPDAKIGIYDGPPLLSIWSFNINNGRLGGFFDLMAANPAIREIQNQRTQKALSLLNQGWDEMGLRLGQEEMEYQDGVGKLEKRALDKWTEHTPLEEVARDEKTISSANIASKKVDPELATTRLVIFNGVEVMKNIHDFGIALSALKKDQVAVILVQNEAQANVISSHSRIKKFKNFQIMTVEEAGLDTLDLAAVMANNGYRIEDLNNILILPVTDTLKASYQQLADLENRV